MPRPLDEREIRDLEEAGYVVYETNDQFPRYSWRHRSGASSRDVGERQPHRKSRDQAWRDCSNYYNLDSASSSIWDWVDGPPVFPTAIESLERRGYSIRQGQPGFFAWTNVQTGEDQSAHAHVQPERRSRVQVWADCVYAVEAKRPDWSDRWDWVDAGYFPAG